MNSRSINPHLRGRLLTREEVQEHIAHHCGRWSHFDWYFDPKFPLGKLRSLTNGTGPLDDSARGWIAWIGRERSLEDDEQWGSDFVLWWTTGGLYEEECPIVASQQPGGFGVEDGNHRVAVSHENEMTSVPAYVGYAK